MSFDKKGLEKIKAEKDTWERGYKKISTRDVKFTTVSGMDVPTLATPSDLDGFDYMRDLGFPGSYPFTRGVYTTMHQGRLWTMRQFAGFGAPEDTNQRFKFLLEQGQTGLSTAFDMPTLMGYDCDHPRAMGEVGREGVSVSSLADMEVLFDGIRLDEVTTSMTINCTASIIFAMYLAVAEKKGGLGGKNWTELSRTI